MDEGSDECGKRSVMVQTCDGNEEDEVDDNESSDYEYPINPDHLIDKNVRHILAIENEFNKKEIERLKAEMKKRDKSIKVLRFSLICQ